MTMLPQVMLSGMIFPLTSMPWGVRWISYLLPLTYFIQIVRGVFLKATPIDALGVPFLALTALAVVVLGLALLRFRRDLAPSGRRPARRDGGRGGVVTWGVAGLAVSFGPVLALEGITLEVPAGPGHRRGGRRRRRQEHPAAGDGRPGGPAAGARGACPSGPASATSPPGRGASAT